MTPLNCAAQAERDLLLLADSEDGLGHETNAGHIRWIAEVIYRAHHFMLPANGTIFNDKFRGLKDVPVHLPYRNVTAEYAVDKFFGSDSPGRVLVVANEDEKFINVMVCFRRDGCSWVCMPISCGIRSGHTLDIFEEETKADIVIGNVFPDKDINCRDKFFSEPEDVRRQIVNSMLAPLLEMLEALSCSNVHQRSISSCDPAVNRRRLAAGKLPIYETKVLVVSASESDCEVTALGHARLSPRQHLRRGHIRRLGDRKLWINSCIVGNASNGVIHKAYDVRP